MRIATLLLMAGFLALGLVAMADSPFLPGLTVDDDHPNGCVDCHKVDGDDDDRLNTKLTAKGHVDISMIVRTVPNDCYMCHKEGAAAGPLSLETHTAHYSNPAENQFIEFYQGACLQCHSLDTQAGVMSVKSGPKNW